MQILGKKGLGKTLKVFLQICFYLGIIILIILPFILKEYNFNIGTTTFVIYPNGTILLMITYNFIKLFNSLSNNNPFCIKNTKILKKTSTISIVGSILWLIDFLYEIILAKSSDIILNSTLLFLSILFLGVSIALYIISELMKQATEYKQENELTI